MASGKRAGGGLPPGRREPSGPLARLVFRLASQLLGGRVETTVRPERRESGRPQSPAQAVAPPPETNAPATEAAQILERALAHVESMPRDLADLKRSLSGVFQQLDETLNHLGMEARRLADESTRLGAVAARLEERLNAFGGREEQPPEAPPVPTEPRPEEPSFWPGDGPLAIVLAAVPGFQGLMDAQRSLSGLGGASVVAYKNGEASLDLALRAPVTARQIVERLRASTGHSILIEEVRPEALRLRLRFVVPEGRG